MATTQLRDGGYVDVRTETVDGETYQVIQKFTGAGQPVGAEYREQWANAPQIVPLSDGGFIADFRMTVRDGVAVYGRVFNETGALANSVSSAGLHPTFTAHPDGGFLFVVRDNGRFGTGDVLATVYDNDGVKVLGSADFHPTGGVVPTASTEAGGDYRITWVEGSTQHVLRLDRDNPDITPPATGTPSVIDDVAPGTGVFTTGGGVPPAESAPATNDPTPIVRVPVTEVGWFKVEAGSGGYGVFHGYAGVNRPVTAEDVARGYIDVQLQPLSDGPLSVQVQTADLNNIVSAATLIGFRVDTVAPVQPTIQGATDDQGPSTGPLQNGATTDDATPTLRVGVAGAQPGDLLNVFRDGTAGNPTSGVLIGGGSVTSADAARGYMEITPTLSVGAHTFHAYMSDRAGNQGPGTPQFHLTVTQSQGQVINSPGPGSTLQGGAGADTLNASQGADVLTGGGGADSFAYAALPWSAGRITDFALGTDRLDLSAIFRSVGYTGSDPVADGRMRFESDGAGGTRLFFDRDAPNAGDWPFHITTLQNVSPAGLTWARLAGEAGPQPPPPATVTFSGGSVAGSEGNSGTSNISFWVYRQGETSGSVSVNWAVTPFATASASASDFAGGAFPTGQLSFAPGESQKQIFVPVAGDTTVEPDESFTLTLSGASGATIGQASIEGRIANDDAAPSGGQVINSPGPGSTLQGGAGADTLNASQGADVLTGGGGADAFAWAQLPWSAGRVTDFTVGSDRLDLSAIFRSTGYTGSDPIADGRMRLESDGAGGTRVYFDRDAPNSGDWPFLITTLQNVNPSTLTWAQLSGGGAGPPPTGGAQIGFSGSSASVFEGSDGFRTIGLYVNRTGGSEGAASVEWTLAPSGGHPVDTADFGSSIPGSGIVNFAHGEATKYIVLTIHGDTTAEPDETFTVTLGAPQNAALGPIPAQTMTILNDDAVPPPPSNDGQVFTSDQYGDTMVGGAGNDTFSAGQGPDKLTGAAGDDRFVFGNLPWVHGEITDFTPGEDILDLSALAPGYTGSDPIGDGYLEFRASGGTVVYVDPDGPGGEWPFAITFLRTVSPGQIGSGDWIF